METGQLWRRSGHRLHRREYADVELVHILADNAAMQIVKNPRPVRRPVTDNLFGDILSDEAAQSRFAGHAASAALGVPGSPGLYEPIHGSAPEYRRPGPGQSAGRHPFLRDGPALVALAAPTWPTSSRRVARTLDGGARTRDIGGALTTARWATPSWPSSRPWRSRPPKPDRTITW